MRRLILHGYNADGSFEIKVSETEMGSGPEVETITLTRAECQKVSKHMQYGKKGEQRVIETVNGEIIKP